MLIGREELEQEGVVGPVEATRVGGREIDEAELLSDQVMACFLPLGIAVSAGTNAGE